MNDIEKRARKDARKEFFNANRSFIGDGPLIAEAIEAGFDAGAAYALGNQWRDAEEEKPTHRGLVLVEVEEYDTPEIRFCTAYFQDGIWVMPDDYYQYCKVLRWLEIPECKPKGE